MSLLRASAAFLPMLGLMACLSTASAPRAQAQGNGIAAVVNGKVITRSEVAEAINAQRQMIMIQDRDRPMEAQRKLAELDKTALDSLIDKELVLAEFTKVGGVIKPQYIDDDINTLVREQFKGDRDAFVIELAKSGMTLKKFREMREKMIILQVMRGKQGGNQPPPTPREVEDYYKKHADKFRDKDMIKIRTITVPKFSGEATATPEKQRQLTEELRSKVIAGSDFGTLAKTYSMDSRAENGGEWDWMERKLMKPGMAEAAFATKDGGVSRVVEDEAAYLIIYVEAKKLGNLAPLDKVRSDIEKVLSAEKSKGEVEKWQEGLRKKAVIRKF